ncbi:MAG: DUF2065 domain-containing protein [Gammaproteobacteria bacterium]|nr:DUF2065 domain-containing protein [Gammaproteobacteria bacterium]
MSEWQALAAGFAFYLILEGLMPFFNPSGFKRALAMSLQFSENQLRTFGAVMLIVGLIILFSLK